VSEESTEATVEPEISASGKKVGRPPKHRSRVAGSEARPDRIPIGVPLSKLNVIGKNPDFHYRWVHDEDERGTRIHRHELAGFTFANPDDLVVSERMIKNNVDLGKIVRVPSGKDGRYLYLMQIRRDWYIKDQKAKQIELDKVEEQMKRRLERPDGEGQYNAGRTRIDSSRNANPWEHV
jgi:hypothetical protein